MKTHDGAASHWNGRWRASHEIMVATAVVGILVANRTNHRKFVRNLGKIRNYFAEMNSRNSRRNRLELAADVNGCFWLRIEGFVMGWPAIEPYQDAIHMTRGDASSLRGTRTKTQQLRKPKPANRTESELDKITTPHSVAFLWCVHGFSG